MTTSLSPADRRWRWLLWAGAACIAVAWIATVTGAALGSAAPWPSWLMLVSVSGMHASNVLRPSRPKGSVIFIVAMAALSAVALVGFVSGAR